MNTLLYVTLDKTERIPPETIRNLHDVHVLFLDLSESGIQSELPDSWKRLNSSELFDPDMFRRDFLRFLEEWPKKAIFKQQCFDELFRLRDGYSVWWTSVGAVRTPSNSNVKMLKQLWVLDRALQHTKVERVVLNGRSRELDNAITLRCQRDSILVERNGRTLSTKATSGVVGAKWLAMQLVQLTAVPFKITTLALFVRILTRGHQESRSTRSAPAILLSPNLSRLVKMTDAGVEIPFWDAFLNELKKQFPDVRQKFLLFPKQAKKGHWNMVRWLRDSGAELLDKLDGALPPAERSTGLISWGIALPKQIAALLRFYRIDKSADFRSSFTFANANIYELIIPALGKAVSNMAEWEREVGVLTTTFSRAGNIKAVLLLAEFYRPSMRYIAAAKRLNIPAIGVQHGGIMPMHLVYTVPQGHVGGAPIPSYFAVYGEYVKDIVCKLGAYPEDRVWIAGCPRMDVLVNNVAGRASARAKLDLPTDKKIILLATHTYRTYPWFIQVIKSVFQATADQDDCVVCVKTHPGDVGMLNTYREAAKHSGNASVKFFGDHFETLLIACDFLISGSSTTVLEATLLGRPTICANFSEEPDRFPYVDDGASLPARDDQELRRSIETLLSDQGSDQRKMRREAFVRRHLGPTAEGRGAEAMVQFISPLLSSHVN
ncbi:hypothetical protein Mal15_37120 [Stieleria maiorica]|uniref:CDP-Glycerol:Poly(Glycerophosphate) glycerophosphotransferase n=1 Tax=Stieleria maiorica TaxID=2795974 RepID=A0A5B9MHX6_9BACT|nr:CDP-glycerol glycerophosphotransferase family protein [Stieleria maiorica]QEF99646.1 hypothetical protein Mal15_37120 [Stieleria maiorica]